jgi:hypothetical protein
MLSKQVYYELIAQIFDLQKYSCMFWVQPVAIHRELHCSKVYTAFAELNSSVFWINAWCEVV